MGRPPCFSFSAGSWSIPDRVRQFAASREARKRASAALARVEEDARIRAAEEEVRRRWRAQEELRQTAMKRTALVSAAAIACLKIFQDAKRVLAGARLSKGKIAEATKRLEEIVDYHLDVPLTQLWNRSTQAGLRVPREFTDYRMTRAGVVGRRSGHGGAVSERNRRRPSPIPTRLLASFIERHFDEYMRTIVLDLAEVCHAAHSGTCSLVAKSLPYPLARPSESLHMVLSRRALSV
jgi:hypothetical protein